MRIFVGLKKNPSRLLVPALKGGGSCRNFRLPVDYGEGNFPAGPISIIVQQYHKVHSTKVPFWYGLPILTYFDTFRRMSIT